MLKINIPENLTRYNYERIMSDSKILSEKLYKKPVPVFSYGEIDVLTRGNMSMIQGKAKSRKTFFMLLLASFVLDCGAESIIIFDTEQEEYHTWRFMQRLKQINQRYDRVNIFNLRRYSKDVRLEFILEHLQDKKPTWAVIDNVRDILKDFNNLSEADDVLTSLVQITENIKTHLTVTLHVNKGDGNARGHLGSELTQKCETVFDISTEDDTTIVRPAYCRNMRFDEARFEIKNGLPVLTSGFSVGNNFIPVANIF